jgi:hypothetical protein
MKIQTQKTGEPFGFATVDLSNILTEGQRLAAVVHGLAPSIQRAEDNHIFDRNYRINAKRLYSFLTGARGPLKDALVVGSKRPGQAPVFAPPFEAAGFRTIFRDRNFLGREKGVDMSVIDILFSILETGDPRHDDITHVGGDTDHLPLIEGLVRHGYRVDILGWRHATSRDVIRAATTFIPLDPYLDYLGFAHHRV